MPLRFTFALILAAALATLAGCASGPSDPAERQRVNAQKQEALRDMLEQGQRN